MPERPQGYNFEYQPNALVWVKLMGDMDMDFWMSNAVLTIPIGIGLRMAAGRNE
jgi:hypothetical protein